MVPLPGRLRLIAGGKHAIVPQAIFPLMFLMILFSTCFHLDAWGKMTCIWYRYQHLRNMETEGHPLHLIYFEGHLKYKKHKDLQLASQKNVFWPLLISRVPLTGQFRVFAVLVLF